MTRVRAHPGDKLNYWTLIKYNPCTGKWLTSCICGKEKEVFIGHLRSGKSTSCSCMGKRKHNMSWTPTYNTWDSMKQRCLNKANDRYSSYGGRGITICSSWENSFENFLNDMGERPVGKTIDRIDNNLGYFKDNCRWVTHKENSRNLLIHQNRGYCITEEAEKSNLSLWMVNTRLQRGYSLEQALTPNKYENNLPQSNSTTGIRGVTFDKSTNKYAVKYKGKWLGRFNTLEQSAQAIKDFITKCD